MTFRPPPPQDGVSANSTIRAWSRLSESNGWPAAYDCLAPHSGFEPLLPARQAGTLATELMGLDLVRPDGFEPPAFAL